jgi:hypothetical protein
VASLIESTEELQVKVGSARIDETRLPTFWSSNTQSDI